MTTATTPALHLFLADVDAFSALLDRAADADWTAASPCEGWSAADVVDHVLDTQRDFVAQRGGDLGPRPEGDPPARWRAHAASVRAASGAGWATTEYDGMFGRTRADDTLARFYGFDLLVHGWDVARATGQDARWTDEQLDRVEAALGAFGDNLYLDGICAPAVEAPDDADRQSRLLARMGRRC